MSEFSIAQSETINIPRETKEEVVSTLLSYPIVLHELDLTKELLKIQKSLNDILTEQNTTQRKQIKILQDLNSKSNTQIDLLKKQLRSKKKDWLTPVLIGAIGGIVIGISL